jgi:hypothetical protein
MRYDNSGVGIAAKKTDKRRVAEVHSLEALRSVDLLEQFELEEQGLEFGASETPIDAAHKTCEMEAARMPGRGLQQSLEATAKIGRAADVRLGVDVRAIESEDGGRLRQLSERGFGVAWIKCERLQGERLKLTRQVRGHSFKKALARSE